MICLGAVTALCVVPMGCATSTQSQPEQAEEFFPQLPVPDLTLNISGLGPSNDHPNREFQLNSKRPVTVLVHGCYGSAGKFRELSKVLAFHGQQSVCFSYDDRASLDHSARELADAIELLSAELESQKITIIGHSLGGLIARKALVADQPDPIAVNAEIALVTVSAPFAGIRAAQICANPFLRIVTLGLHDLLSWILIGDKWYEITSASDFIKHPGVLGSFVERHLLIATDEEGTCREYSDDGTCLKDDFVITLGEQELPAAYMDEKVSAVTIRAGHAAIVGESGRIPEKLIQLLQREGYVRFTDPSRTRQFDELLADLYGWNH